jgi:hypothetical protein
MSKKFETAVTKPETKIQRGESHLHLITSSDEEKLDTTITEIRDFMSQNTGRGKSNSEKDSLYLEAQKIWKSFIDTLEGVKYNFYLDKEQTKFLIDLIQNKLEYDVNSVFFALEIKSLVDEIRNSKNSDNETLAYPMSATDVTYIYHLISQHKVKGLGKDSILFSQVLLMIGNVSKIFNYYDTTGKNLATDIQDWVLTFEESVNFEDVKAQVVEPLS